VIVGTFDASRAFLIGGATYDSVSLLFLAWFRFIEKRMILLLLPSVTRLATSLVWASFMILGNESSRLPVRAYILAVI